MTDKSRESWANVALLLIAVYAVFSAFALNEYNEIGKFQNESVSILGSNDLPFSREAGQANLTDNQKDFANFYYNKFDLLKENGQNYLIGFIFGSPFFLFLLYGIILIVLGDTDDNPTRNFSNPSIKTTFLYSFLSIPIGIFGYMLNRAFNLADSNHVIIILPTLAAAIVFTIFLITKFKK